MKNRKKVIHVLNVLNPSGAEIMLYNSADLWMGYDKYILASSEEKGPFAEKLEKAGYCIVHLYDQSIIRKLYRTYLYFQKEKFDVIHIHREGESYLYAFIARIAYSKTHIVKTVHNVFRFSGRLHGIRILTRMSERILGVRYVSIGKSVYQNELEHLKNKSVLINNWCDETRFSFVDEEQKLLSKEKINLKGTLFSIVSVGNCNYVKNHKFLLEVLKQFNQECDEWIYYHIGQGELTEEERYLSQNYGLENHIVYLGRTEPDIYLKACDVFIMPSLNEGVSIAAIEAMRTGIPALFSEAPGLEDFKRFIDAQNEVYFSELDVRKFAEVLETLYAKYKRGELKHSIHQSEHVSKVYNREESVRKYLRVYEGNGK